MRNGFLKTTLAAMACLPLTAIAGVDYSVLSVPEEAGIDFTQITTENDFVAMPEVNRGMGGKVSWFTNRVIDVSTDGNNLAYLSIRNKTSNIFIKNIYKQGSSVQRTNRQAVIDFSYSPDGKYICFCEKTGRFNQIYQTSATSGYVCRQITSNNKDFTPVYSPDMSNIFFARQEANGASVWSYNIKNNFLSSYTRGYNPYPMASGNSILCTRTGTDGRGEIWMVDYETGIEECILADPVRSYSTPQLSPDGRWIVFTGSNVLINGSMQYGNTDIFVCRTDGTQVTQLTYHAADDLSPVWSRDGRYIYFISQRGSATATANVWRMTFNEPF